MPQWLFDGEIQKKWVNSRGIVSYEDICGWTRGRDEGGRREVQCSERMTQWFALSGFKWNKRRAGCGKVERQCEAERTVW